MLIQPNIYILQDYSNLIFSGFDNKVLDSKCYRIQVNYPKDLIERHASGGTNTEKFSPNKVILHIRDKWFKHHNSQHVSQ